MWVVRLLVFFIPHLWWASHSNHFIYECWERVEKVSKKGVILDTVILATRWNMLGLVSRQKLLTMDRWSIIYKVEQPSLKAKRMRQVAEAKQLCHSNVKP